jgi:hypothetical protein
MEGITLKTKRYNLIENLQLSSLENAMSIRLLF